MKTVLLSMFIVLLGGCASVGPRDAATPKPLQAPITVHMWLNEGHQTSGLPNEVGVDGHPCGGVAAIEALRMPLDSAAIEGEVVVEIDAEGNELGYWRVPVDSSTLAIDGELLGMVMVGPKTLWIDKQGRFFAGTPEEAPSTMFDCPPIKRITDSVYLQCHRFTDLTTGQPRLLAMEGVCT